MEICAREKTSNDHEFAWHCFGHSFFVITQAQTSGFEAFFIKTILGTNGAIRISDRFQDMHGTVRSSSKDGKTKILFHSREGARYTEGIENPKLLRCPCSVS